MALYLLITASALAFACLAGRMDAAPAAAKKGRRWRQGMYTAERADSAAALSRILLFLVLFLPEALRQATGNDYMRYVEFFHLSYVDAYVVTEPGFNYLVKLIYSLCGYENYLLVFAVFAAGTILFFLGAVRQQAEDFFFSFFLLMMYGFYFQSYNTVRYYFALSAALFSIRLFLNREYLSFLLLVLFAACFHKSVLVVLVLYPLAAHFWKKWQAAVLIACAAGFWMSRDFWMKVILRLYPSYENTAILAAGGSISWYNIARCTAVLLLVLFAAICSGRKASEWDRAYRFYVNAAALSLGIYIFGAFIPEVSRIAYYLVATQIFLIPAAVRSIPDSRGCRLLRNPRTGERIPLKQFVTVLTAAAAVLMFAAFLYRAYDPEIRILPYRSFLFSELPGTPSRSIE